MTKSPACGWLPRNRNQSVPNARNRVRDYFTYCPESVASVFRCGVYVLLLSGWIGPIQKFSGAGYLFPHLDTSNTNTLFYHPNCSSACCEDQSSIQIVKRTWLLTLEGISFFLWNLHTNVIAIIRSWCRDSAVTWERSLCCIACMPDVVALHCQERVFSRARTFAMITIMLPAGVINK